MMRFFQAAVCLTSLLARPLCAAVLPQRLLPPLAYDEGNSDEQSPLPLIIWHGLGDNFDADGIKSVGQLAQRVNPNTFVYNVRLGDDATADQTATFWGNVTEQVATVCDELANNTILATAPAVNALGFSQGGQFLRAYVERCNAPPVASLVTFGAQHDGISSFNKCADGDWLCLLWEGALRTQTWSSFVQKNLVPAQYFRDPENLQPYLEYSNFLADVNNEREVKNATYKENMEKLKRFVMYKFSDDKVVAPISSSWFAETNKTTGNVTKLQDRKIYKEDWLGLKKLDGAGKLEFREIEGGHMELTEEILVDAFEQYFSDKVDIGPQRSSLLDKLAGHWSL